MVRLLLYFLCVVLSPVTAKAQRQVDPNDLTLTVTVEELDYVPYQQEMVLLTIHGVYKRHITLEKLEMPELKGMNWMQLGQDNWFESFVDGRTVKNMRRRMAVFPDESGSLTIGRFKHHLTLLDENNAWFEHTIESKPITIQVAPAPPTDGWWFPTRRLRIADNWSNAPDQLRPGEGVLRIVRVSALGASPDMIPPMPELTSPSALIFAHPEKRLVDLTPQGPEAIAYWRWTITPSNSVSAILEPFEFGFFDTVNREARTARISPQRVAFLKSETDAPVQAEATLPVILRSGMILASGITAFGLAFAMLTGPGQTLSTAGVRSWLRRRQLLSKLRSAGRDNNLVTVRHTAVHLADYYPKDTRRDEILRAIDTAIFSRSAGEPTASQAASQLLSTYARGGSTGPTR